ncbi:type II toxin-antitoxin system Phd/YefM family antitoxin [Salana multivorans]
MTIVVNVQEAKTRLSELLHRVESGEEVVIARAGKEIARLQPVTPRTRSFDAPLLSSLGSVDANAFLEPATNEELADWEEGHAGDPLTQLQNALGTRT